jgi:hypothetical protein
MGFSYLDIYESQKAKEEIQRKTAYAEQVALDSEYRKVNSLKESADMKRANKVRAYADFKKSVSETYVTGMLQSIYETVLDMNSVSDFAKGIGISALHKYVTENGADNLIRRMNGKTLFLSEAANMLNDYITEAIEDADVNNPDTYAIDPDDEQEFYDNLSQSDEIEDITNAIRMRVVDAEEKMATDNIQDKLDMDDIMRGAAERIKAVKQSNEEGETTDDSADIQQQEAVMMSKARMNSVTTGRSRSVLEQMVRSTSKEVMRNPELAKVYAEDGKINYDKLIEANTAIYTLMEMLNTIQLEDYSSDSIKAIVS